MRNAKQVSSPENQIVEPKFLEDLKILHKIFILISQNK